MLIADRSGEALRELYERYAGWLVLRLMRRCSDREVVDEVVQDTFMGVWRNAARFRGEGPVAAWIWGIGIRRLVERFRRRLGPTRGWWDTSGVQSSSAEEMVLLGVEHGDLAAAMDGLSPELRAVLRATVLDGLTTREAKGSGRHVTLALARVDGKHLLKSPLFLAGLGVAMLGTAVFVLGTLTDDATTWSNDAWTIGTGFILAAVFAMLTLVSQGVNGRQATLTLAAMFAGLVGLTLGIAGVAAHRTGGRGGAVAAPVLMLALIVSAIFPPQWRPLPLGDVPGGWPALQVRWSTAAVIGALVLLATCRDPGAPPL